MGGSTTNFSQAGESNRPSPSIWADCPNTLLNDLGLGYFYHNDFLGGPVTATVTAASAIIPGMSILADAATVASYVAGRVGGFLDIETDGDDNDAFTAHTEPLGTITRNSGKKFWFEARVELGDVAMDGGFFVGLVEEAGATLELVADDAAALIGESYVGFRVLADDPDAVDAVYKKDAGTEVEVLADVTNATAIATADRASLVNDTAVKLGIKFDGRTTLSFYVNGIKVASQDVDSTIDQTKNYAAAVSIKTGAAAAESFAMDFFRVAHQDISG